MKTFSAEQMRMLEQRTIQEFGTPGDILMERAGQSVAKIANDLLQARNAQAVLLIAGKGNNGGDVFAAATLLAQKTPYHVEVWICGSERSIKGDAEHHLKKMKRAGVVAREVNTAADFESVQPPDLIIDGLLGTGSRGAPRGFMQTLIEWINEESYFCPVLSIDLPSGIDPDTGRAAGVAVTAHYTVVLGAIKTGLIREAALPYFGRIHLVDIGIPQRYIDALDGDPEADFIDSTDLRHPRRRPLTHKGDYGHVLLIGGSVGTTGAIAMAARAALRTGAGVVSVLTPEAVYPIVAQAAGPEVMVLPFSDLDTLTVDFENRWKKVTSVCVGPGLEQNPAAIERLLADCPVPIALDAGALCVTPEIISEAECPVVITPHVGEFKRLFDCECTNRWEQAKNAAETLRKTVILKGAGTVVAHPGEKLAINLTGNPGMATAGSGDVLAGILAALLGQGMKSDQAARHAVYLHGRAADIAVEKRCEEALIATDIIEAISHAIWTIRT